MNEIVKSDLQKNNLVRLLEVVDSATNRGYLTRCDNGAVEEFKDKELGNQIGKNLKQTSLFRVTRLVYEADENPAEKLKSFFLAFSDLNENPSIFFVLQNKRIHTILNELEIIAHGSSCNNKNEGSARFEFTLYIGAKPQGVEQSEMAEKSVREALEETFCGTFLGSKIVPISTLGEKKSILQMDGSPDIVCVTAQPSVKKDSDQKTIDVGLEYFVDVMRNREYTAVLLAQPVAKTVIEDRRRDLENLYSKLSLFQKVTVAFGNNTSTTIGKNISDAIGTSESIGKNFTTTRSESVSTSTGGGSNSSYSSSYGSNGNSSGSSYGSSSSWNRTETIGTSESEGITFTLGKNTTRTEGSNSSRTEGNSITHTVEAQNKSVVDLLSKLDDTLKRMDDAENFGLWECSAYFMAKTFKEAAFAANTFKSLVIGDESSGVRSHTIYWPRENVARQKQLCRWILGGEHPRIASTAAGFPNVLPTSLVSGRDLPYLFRLPQKSVPGIAVETFATFERSIARTGRAGDLKKPIDFGNICHMDMEELPMQLDLADFTKHVFICGSTGCGKSNTTELLLQRCFENDVKFLVVEPAKGEYKKSFKNLRSGINVFTTHPLCERLLRVNPFKFPDGIHVLEHVDRLLEIFSACWELTAAMPAILKRGVEQAYRNVGWDLSNSYYIGDGEIRYPTFASLISTLSDIIKYSEYSAEAKGNYTGALVTRVESLTAGVLRQIFCSGMDLDGNILFEQNTIVDLSRLGSAETKSLLMGVLVMQLSEWRQVNRSGTNEEIKHVTVIEEAHNLLRRQENGGSDLVRKSVESIANAIAEMRTYGEGFVIVDQSPGAVDISAIKNTNTKIVMRLPEKSDCEAIASSMGLDENQTSEIAKLPTGVAVVMQNTWTSAVLCKVSKSYPPKGAEEWTDSRKNREVRALLALQCGHVGYSRGKWFSKDNKFPENPPGYKDVLDYVDKYTYDFEIGEVRRRELHEIFQHCNKEYCIDGNESMTGNWIGYGMLAITILGCWDCWRGVENKCDFEMVMNRYIPDSIREKYRMLYEESFGGMIHCIGSAFKNKVIPNKHQYGAILQSGGTEVDRREFEKALSREKNNVEL